MIRHKALITDPPAYKACSVQKSFLASMGSEGEGPYIGMRYGVPYKATKADGTKEEIDDGTSYKSLEKSEESAKRFGHLEEPGTVDAFLMHEGNTEKFPEAG